MRPVFLSLLILPILSPAQHRGRPEEQATPLFTVETRLVEVYASVFDRKGNPVPGLTRERFQVLDDGRAQPMHAFEGSGESLSCALVLDLTGSMAEFLPKLQNSALRFIDELRDGEQVAVYTFSTSLRQSQDFTTDKKLVKQAILRTRTRGSTALFDSVATVTRDLESRKGKKAIVLFTDGMDNASTLTAAGSSRRAHLSGIPIYAIAQGDALKDRKLLQTLAQLATDTGGLSFKVTNPNQISEVFAEISRSLTHTYLLTWKLPAEARPGWHPIRISISGLQGARIRARQGYYSD